MCLASWATELATNSEAISARITASGVAPPPKAMPMGMEKAVAMAGAMNVIDWNSTPPKPTAPRRNSPDPPLAGAGSAGEGTSPVAIGTLLDENAHDRPDALNCTFRAGPSRAGGAAPGNDMKIPRG